MYLTRLSCLNYRNLRECDLRFSGKFNCFLGANGMGKTNLLDAIYYLSFTKSHLNSVDSQLICHDGEYFMLQGEYERNGQEEIISAAVKRKTKKQFRRNKKEYGRMADHIGLIPAVLISPSDHYLIADGSDERRRFMDSVISQYDRQYLASLMRYNQALQSRNMLLRQESMPDVSMLEIYEVQMSSEARYIYARRLEFITGFTPVFERFYSLIAGDGERVSLCYKSHSERGDIAPLLAECRLRDHAIGYTTRGSHKDDIEMLIDGYPIKRTGSQGQNKTYLVALKLAQYVYLHRVTGVKPLLLLDDIFDKLDSARVKNIMQIVASDDFGQIFITDTDRNHTDRLMSQVSGDTKLFSVINGEVIE